MQVRRIGAYSARFYAGLLGVMLVGVLLGSLFYSSMDSNVLGSIGRTGSGFVSLRQHADFPQILLRTLSSSTLFLLVIFLSGLCAVGQPFAACALAVRGLGMGVVFSQLYSGFGVKGMLYSAVLVLPNALICSVALVLGAREAICLSNRYAVFSLSDRQQDGLKETLRRYCAKFLVLEAVLAVSAGMDCLVTWITKGFVPVLK